MPEDARSLGHVHPSDAEHERDKALLEGIVTRRADGTLAKRHRSGLARKGACSDPR